MDNVVTRFLRSDWIKKAKPYVFNPKKLQQLLLRMGSYVSKKGLGEVKESLTIMGHYLSDVAKGHYKDYDKKNLTLIVAAIIYVVAPFDFFPDFIPGGLIDDASIIAWAFSVAAEELEKYKAFINKPNQID